MAELSGKFQYLDERGGALLQGACRVEFDAEKFTLVPQQGAAIVVDLGDFDAVQAADWEIRLPIYTGRVLVLRQFGKAYDNLAHDLLEAYRKRAVQCLLLEDLNEVERFTGNFELTSAGTSRSGPAELRLYKSNFAVLPSTSQPFQWRLADVDSLRFENYEVLLEAGCERLKITRLAKRTEEFVSRLRDAMNTLAKDSALALHASFPFLDPDQLQACATLMREGRSARLAKLEAINPRVPAALAVNAVDANLKPYYDELLRRTAAGMLYAGFKLIRPEDTADSAGDTNEASDESVAVADNTSAAADADHSGSDTLYWFFFPIAAKPGSPNVIAWEASSRSGRATYFFRLGESGASQEGVDQAVQRINRA